MIGKHQEKLNKFLEKSQVALVYLFGSQAKGTAHKESDVDIGVLFDEKVCSNEYMEREGRLITFFSGIYPKKEINIVNLNISPPLLKQAVVFEGKELYVRSRTDHILFQIKTLREYEDFLHLSGIYNQFLELKLKAL